MDEAIKEKTRARFAAHREAWQANAAVRALYEEWYQRLRAELPPIELGPRVELGSGPGLGHAYIPDLILSDIVRGPQHAITLSALELPFAPQSLGALVLFDVLHHLPAPGRFFADAARVLRPRGRVVMCEPYVGAISYPIYKFLHDEPVHMNVNALDEQKHGSSRDPFDSNQAIPTLIFGRQRAQWQRRFPDLRVTKVEKLAGLAYPASGGLARRKPFVPMAAWSVLRACEARLPAWMYRFLGFRMLATIERG